jgi:hypothetical protein
VGCSWCLCLVPLCFATRLRFATWRALISSAASWRSGVASPPRVANSVSTAPAFGDAGVATHRRTLISAAVLRHRPPRGRLRWPQVRLHQPPPVQYQGHNPALVEGRTLSLQAAGWGPPLFRDAVEIKSSHCALWPNN